MRNYNPIHLNRRRDNCLLLACKNADMGQKIDTRNYRFFVPQLSIFCPALFLENPYTYRINQRGKKCISTISTITATPARLTRRALHGKISRKKKKPRRTAGAFLLQEKASALTASQAEMRADAAQGGEPSPAYYNTDERGRQVWQHRI